MRLVIFKHWESDIDGEEQLSSLQVIYPFGCTDQLSLGTIRT